jgi:hypothetical protein
MAASKVSEVCRDFDCTLDELSLLAELSLAAAEQDEQDEQMYIAAVEQEELENEFEEDFDDFVANSELDAFIAEEALHSTPAPCRYGDACRYNATGSCHFSHKPAPCRYGDACRFNATGTCRFGH